MATYVISDIHGQLDKFKEMLDLIDLKFDGSDHLHILGDMIDWGKQSLETLLFCKDLTHRYSFIHVYRGNHEQMMLETLKQNNFIKGDNFQNSVDAENIIKGNWYANNGGDRTYNTFINLDESSQIDIIEYLDQLPYFNEDVQVNGQKFYLAHAAPYTDNPSEVPQMYKRYQKHDNGFHFVIWHRFGELEQSFTDEKYKDYILIHGHTPTNATNDEGLYVIQRTRDRICIDTGAKKLYMSESYPQSRLGCLRLDDMAEFYIR